MIQHMRDKCQSDRVIFGIGYDLLTIQAPPGPEGMVFPGLFTGAGGGWARLLLPSLRL